MSNDNKAMKVPQAGCDRLTDPSEIAALGKYLKKKRIDLEDSITLPTIKGTPTSDLKNNITSLSENVERLRTDKISLLEEDALHKIIGESKEINSLGNQRVEAEGVEEIINKLSGNLEKLEGSKEVSLSDQLLTLKEESIEDLSKTVSLIIGDKDNNALEETVHKIIGADHSLKELEKTSKEIEGIHKKVESLESTTHTLNVVEKNELSESVLETIDEKDIKELGKVLNSIPGEKKDIELETKKETISIDDIEELPVEKVNLDLKNNISSLDTNLIDIIGGEKEISLEETLEKIKETISLDDLPSRPAENVIGDSQKISQLIGKNELIVGEKKNIENLEGKAITIDPKEVETLSTDKALDIIGSEKNPFLSTTSEKIEGNKEEISLGQYVESIINGNQDLSLEKQPAERVEGGEKSLDKLGESIEEVIGSTETIGQLKGETEKVEGVNPIIENLGENFTEKVKEDTKHVIDNLSEILDRISDYKEGDLELEGTTEGISDGKKDIASLENTAELIQGTPPETLELSNEISIIEGIKDSPKLEKHVESLGGIPETPELENYTEKIDGISETSELSNHREDITIEDIDSLSSTLEDVIGNVEDSELSNFLDSPKGIPETPELSDKVLKEVTPKEVSLGNEVLGITTEDVDSLSDFLDTLNTEEDSELSNHREDITIEDIDSLSSTLEDVIGNVEDSELSNHREDITTEDIEKLSNHLEKTEKNSDKINVGRNLIPGDKDDYLHTGWDDKLDNRKIKAEKDTNKFNVSGEVHEQFNPEIDSLYTDNLSPEINTKFNAGSNGDSYLHTGWDGSLDDERRRAKTGIDAGKINIGRNLVPLDLDNPDSVTYQQGWSGKFDDAKRRFNPEIDSDKENVSGEVHEQFNPEIDSLYTDNLSPEINNAGRNLIPGDEDDYLHDDAINQLVNIIKSRKDLQLYYTNILKFAQKKNLKSGWASKITALMSAYLSGESSEEKLKEFEQQLFKTIFFEYKKDLKEVRENEGKKKEIGLRNESTYVTKYKLNQSWQNVLDMSQYLRLVAEEATFGKHGSLRALLLDTTLMTLVATRNVMERLTGANRDSVPGKNKLMALTQGNLVENAKSATRKIAKAGIGALTSDPNNLVDKTYPLNRPDDKWYQTDGWQSGNNRGTSVSEENNGGSILKSIGKAMLGEMKGIAGIGGERGYKFRKNYIESNEALKTTLSELCEIEESVVSSVEDLKLAIESSRYMTSASKVTVDQFNSAKGRITTLDDNSNWEIIFCPFLEKSNGYVTYLPPVAEINRLNRKLFHVETGYCSWIPFTSFELSKSRMVSKTIQLFDGEISYPVGMECANDLRLTIADDQYKSWRRYFELCANCAVYYSTKHSMTGGGGTTTISPWINITSDDYNSKELITKVDKSFICPAPYKNITFRCLIYCMTPQKETINKYDLLLVMKDFSEERSGDIDPGGSDLTISFSIVGEHPKTDTLNLKKADYFINKKKIEDQNKLEKANDRAALAESIIQAAAGTALDGALNMI